MFRSFLLFCSLTFFSLSVAFAQDVPSQPEPVKATPEMLALFNESFQSLSQAEAGLRAGGLFRLLGFAVNFDDPAPAQKVADALLELAPAIEPKELRSQLYEGVASALCDIGKYTEAIGVLDKITASADRYEPQMNLAISLVRSHEEDKTLKPFDASELLRRIIAGAVEAKNISIEAAARIFLGRELARQDKQNESVAAFREAMMTAQKIEDAGVRNDTIGLLFQSQVQYKQTEEAKSTLKLVSEPEHKRLCAEVLIRFERYDDAEQLLQSLPAGELKDSGLFEFAVATIKTITEEKIAALSASISSDEQRERFIQRMIVELQKNDREDGAVLLGKRLKDPTHINLVLLLGKVESLMEKKQFAEAIEFINKSEEDETILQHFRRQILMAQYRETHEDSVAAQIAETYSAEEKMVLAELNESAKQGATISDPAEQVDVFFEILKQQFQLMDIAGVKQTIKLVSEQLDKEKDIVRIIQSRLLLARLQSEMQEKQGVKENLAKLMQAVSAVKDLNTLKGLLPEPPQSDSASETAEGGAIKLNLPVAGNNPPVDESAIREQLFQLYLMSASLLANADASVESKSALEKAKELANAEAVAERRADKLLLLSQILAEMEQDR